MKKAKIAAPASQPFATQDVSSTQGLFLMSVMVCSGQLLSQPACRICTGASLLLPFTRDCLPEMDKQSQALMKRAAANCKSPKVDTAAIVFPDVCPSLACAQVFGEFFEDCGGRLQQHPQKIPYGRAKALNEDCSQLVRDKTTSDGCKCSVCAATKGGTANLCVPWQIARPCNCTSTHSPVQAFPITDSKQGASTLQ